MDWLEAVHDKFEVVVFTGANQQEVYASELFSNQIDQGEYIIVCTCCILVCTLVYWTEMDWTIAYFTMILYSHYEINPIQ